MSQEPKPDKPWHPSPRIRAFLAAYRATCSITKAAEAAGISRRAHYRKLETSADYRLAFDAATAMAADALEDEAVRRAKEGIVRQVLYHGTPAMELVDPLDPGKGMRARMEREYSDTLLLALLKAKKPKEYAVQVRQELSGPGGGPIDSKIEVIFVGADGSPIPAQTVAAVRAPSE